MAGVPIGLHEVGKSISDVWERYTKEVPDYPLSLYVKMPGALGGVKYNDSEAAATALVRAINGVSEKSGMMFEEGSAVSTNGRVAYHVVEREGETCIKRGFWNKKEESKFLRHADEDLEGVTALRVGKASLVPPPPEVKLGTDNIPSHPSTGP